MSENEKRGAAKLSDADIARLRAAMRTKDRAQLELTAADTELGRLLLDLSEDYDCDPEGIGRTGEIKR